MRRRWVLMMIILLNLPQVLASTALAVYAIWFADYEQRNVGPLVSHAAETTLTIAVTQVFNAMLWLILRAHPAEVRFLMRIVLASLFTVAALIWIGSHFVYAGSS